MLISTKSTKLASTCIALCAAGAVYADEFTVHNVPPEARVLLNGAAVAGTYDLGHNWLILEIVPAEGDVLSLTAPLYADLSVSDTRVVEKADLRKTRVFMSAHTVIANGVDPAQSYGIPFSDCAGCPDMVIVPGGDFVMGAAPGEPGSDRTEGPQQNASVGTFAISQREVTFEEWSLCARAGACDGYVPHDEGYGAIGMPVINVNYHDVVAYTQWLSSLNEGISYRLPTEAEWEYATRAGTQTAFWTGEQATRVIGNFNNRGPRPAGSYGANAFDLFDVSGNVWEWVSDCWREQLNAPIDTTTPCEWYTQRGGSWTMQANAVRSANRRSGFEAWRHPAVGFRVVRELDQSDIASN